MKQEPTLTALAVLMVHALDESEAEFLMAAIDQDGSHEHDILDQLQRACKIIYPDLYKRLCGDDKEPVSDEVSTLDVTEWGLSGDWGDRQFTIIGMARNEAMAATRKGDLAGVYRECRRGADAFNGLLALADQKRSTG